MQGVEFVDEACVEHGVEAQADAFMQHAAVGDIERDDGELR